MADTTSHFRTTEIGDFPYEGGVLKHVTVKSPALKARADCSVYAPNQVQRGQSVPVVILLHGVYGSHWIWNGMGQAHTTLQALIDQGEVAPMILTTPSDGLWGDGSGYLKHNRQDFERWIVEDVPELVHEVTGNAKDVSLFIGGLSMGGYGALRIGARHPGKFKAFSGHSSITVFEEMSQFVEEPLERYNIEDPDAVAVITAMRSNREHLAPFQFDCGIDDPLIEGNRTFHHQLKEAGIPHEYTEHPGGHEWSYWTKHVATTFRFFDRIQKSKS